MTVLEQLEQQKTDLVAATQAKLVVLDEVIAAVKRLEALGLAVPALPVSPPQVNVTREPPEVPKAPAAPKKASDTPEVVHRRAADLKDPVLEWLKTHGPMNTKAIARGLGVRIPPVRTALHALESERKVHTTGIKRSQRWNLGPKVPVKPAVASLPTVPANRHVREDGGTVPPASVEEAIRAARRYSHTLGPFKPSSAGAGSAFIARCTGCDTYVTIGRDGKVSGPGTRHDCLAKTGS